MCSRNSSRRLRFASVSRSTAWSDFFLAADPAGLTTAEPSTNSSLRPCREPVVGVTRLWSDPDAPQPEWRSGRILLQLDGSSVRACSAPALLVRSPAAGGKSSPHTQDSHRTPLPASGSCHAPCRGPQISCAAGRPRRLSPSSSAPQSLASSTLHHLWYRLRKGPRKRTSGTASILSTQWKMVGQAHWLISDLESMRCGGNLRLQA
jgi:hypothetical protein